MAHPDKRIEELERQAAERAIVSQLTPDRETWLKAELRAAELRRRTEALKQRVARLPHVHPEH